MIFMSPRLSIEEARERMEARMMALEGVAGVGIGERNRKLCIVVYVKKKSPELSKVIPTKAEGYEVYVEESGEFVAL